MADDLGSLVQRIKEANDIVDVLGGYIALRQVGQTFKGLCPFHEDHRPSFDVDPRRQRYRCWSCQKHGDVLSFIQEHERVDFWDAIELLARRAGISLEKNRRNPQDPSRALMLDVVQWAADLYHRCLLESPLAETARAYLDARHLSEETIRRYGLGFAPPAGSWLVQRAEQKGISFEMLVTLGLIAARQEGDGFYDRFRDRVIFPIRNRRGQPVGFGGRILPTSPFAERGPKYYNSSETPLFSKSEQLYGLDQALQAAGKVGYLAIVEGYTDVLMAHQMGVLEVVATMGTALNERHVRQIRRVVPRVVLVFDADEGGNTGVDRALQVFLSNELDLAIATLPEGLDPCDLLVAQGPEPFRQALAQAVDALEYKLNQVLRGTAASGIEGKRRAVDAVLGVIAQAPEIPGQAGAVKRELVVTRIAQRLGLKEETVWARLRELREQADRRDQKAVAGFSSSEAEAPEKRVAKASAEEVELLQVLFAEPDYVSVAAAEVRIDYIQHPGIRHLLEGLYRLADTGERPTLDALRPTIDPPALAARALEWQDLGRKHPNRAEWLQRILARFREKHLIGPRQQELKNQLQTAADHATALDLLRQLQNPN